MHMADALVSPAVGGTMWVAAAATAAHCARKVREERDPAKIPLMGVMGAFIFGAQMLNFTIPGTGSSGHLGGGLILTILLGPEAAFLVIASVLTVQALFMADGGLLALGCNIVNLGVFPAFVAYPLFKRIVGGTWTTGRIFTGSIAAAEVGVVLGAFAVVLETTLSGVSALPFTFFVAAMIPIHIAIGLVEGLVTAAVVLFVKQSQPELLVRTAEKKPVAGLNLKPVIVGVALAAMLSAVALSWFASTNPDGLEWSIARVSGSEQLAAGASQRIHATLASIQEKTAFLPGYGFKSPAATDTETSGPAGRADTSVAGLVGALLTLLVALAVGLGLAHRWRRALRG
ncbi:MAG: cobalamin biosynthesis protein CbiM, partial [Actinobacteria bacterium]